MDERERQQLGLIMSNYSYMIGMLEVMYDQRPASFLGAKPKLPKFLYDGRNTGLQLLGVTPEELVRGGFGTE